jgi:hypothetical protein
MGIELIFERNTAYLSGISKGETFTLCKIAKFR